jgi:2-hydroxy-6-oxo-6-(2'-carboxyphenyl)-hexa-2,4-dienoate hydrolase
VLWKILTMTESSLTDVHEDGGIAGYDPEFIDVDGTRTRYYDLGDPNKDVLLLLHGGNWGGLSSANVWSSSFDALRQRFRVVAFDRIGCGMTDNPESADAFTYGTEVEHALAFLEELGVDRCHVAGSSRGAGLGARLAVEDPDRFRTLVLINSATFGPPAGDESHRYERVFERVAEGIDETDPAYTERRYTQYAHETENIDTEFCRTNAYMRRQPKAERTAEVLDEEGQVRWEETMHKHMRETHDRIKDGELTIPTLYVFGRNDLTVPVEMAMGAYDMIAQKNSKVRMKVVNDCGHLIYREYPEEFANTVANFVDEWHGAAKES